MLRKRVIKHGATQVWHEMTCRTECACRCDINCDNCASQWYCQCDEDRYCSGHVVSCCGVRQGCDTCSCDSCVNVSTCDCHTTYCSNDWTCTKYYCNLIAACSPDFYACPTQCSAQCSCDSQCFCDSQTCSKNVVICKTEVCTGTPGGTTAEFLCASPTSVGNGGLFAAPIAADAVL